MCPRFYLQPDKRVEIDIQFKKVYIERESTRIYPCYEMFPQTCEDVEDYQYILDMFKCHVPFLYSGQHLDKFFSLDLPNCTQEVMKEAMNMISKGNPCKIGQVCQTVKYTYMEQKYNNSFSPQSEAVIILQGRPFISTQQKLSFISYLLQKKSK